jgi:hypothetical protein
MSLNDGREEGTNVIFATALNVVERMCVFFVFAPNPGRTSDHAIDGHSNLCTTRRLLSLMQTKPIEVETPSTLEDHT